MPSNHPIAGLLSWCASITCERGIVKLLRRHHSLSQPSTSKTTSSPLTVTSIMIDVTVNGDEVVFDVEGWDKLWCLRSSLTIPLSHVIDAHQDSKPAMGWFDGIKLGGAAIPNVFKAGTFYQQG